MKTRKGVMEVKIEGQEVKKGRIEITTFTDIVTGIYQGLRRVALNSLGRTARDTRGRYPHKIEELCQFAISGWRRGSVEITLEAIQPRQLDFYDDIEPAITLFIKGISNLPKSTTVLPSGFDPNVITALERVTSNLSTKKGVSHLTFSKQVNGKPITAVIEPRLRPILSNFLKRTQETETKIEGKFYQVNLRQQTAILETFKKENIPCYFDENNEMQIIDGLTHPVRVYGKGETDIMTKRITHLDVKLIEPLPRRTVVVKSKYKEIKGKDPILALLGNGREIWKGINPDDYVHSLREGWE